MEFKFNLPPKVRLGTYVVTGVGSLLMGYLSVKHYIGDPEVALWAGLSAFANGLAALNVKKPE